MPLHDQARSNLPRRRARARRRELSPRETGRRSPRSRARTCYGFADYPTNTILTNESADLGDIVQDDLFKAEVVVAGSLSYETTLGGSTTVPKLTVTKISVIGSAK